MYIHHNKNIQLLGFKHDASARQFLVRKIILSMLKELNMDTCPKCGHKIENVEDFTIGHRLPWRSIDGREGNQDLFWNLDNFQPEHPSCNLPDSVVGINKNGYIGIKYNVYKNTGNYLYQSVISINNKGKILGYSKDPKIAAEFYDIGVMKYKNGYGQLNFPEKREEYKGRFHEIK